MHLLHVYEAYTSLMFLLQCTMYTWMRCCKFYRLLFRRIKVSACFQSHFYELHFTACYM